MMPHKRKLVLTLLSLIIFALGCKEETSTAPEEPNPSGTMTFTLNGGGFSNRTITLSAAVARYDVGEGETGVAAAGISGTDSVNCGLVFPGNQTGTFSWVSGDFGLVFALSNPQRVYFPVSGSTTVSSYGAVGSNVRGTFSGTVTRLGTNETVTVSNGQFSATRIQ